MPTLRIKMPNRSEVTHQLSGERITIGRGPDNTIQISNPAVSARHAELIAEDGHYRLHDLESTNLTFVDGAPVADFHLRQDCRIAFGTVECVFDPMDAAPDESLMSRDRLEQDIGFLRTENADLRAVLAAQQRRVDMLSSARLVTGRTDSTPSSAAQDALRAVVGERNDLRHTIAGLRSEIANLTEELATANRERERLRQALQARHAATAAKQPAPRARAVPPMNGAPVRAVPQPGALTSRDSSSALSALDPNATQRLTPRLDAAFQPIADLLAPLRAALDRVSGVPEDDFSRMELMTHSSELANAAADLGDHPIARLSISVEALLHELLAQPGAMHEAMTRTVAQALDLLARLVEPRQAERAKTLPPPTVLAVDEDTTLLAEMVMSLELAQLHPIACSAPGALPVDPGGRHFNLIILDGDLSGPTAPALCTEIRADPTHRKTPIIMLTWNGAGGLAGGNDFLTKPVNPAELAVKAQTWALRHQFGLP